ncbi:MAG: type II secretion system protein GspG [Pseudomonadota bacterium]
MHRKPFGFTVIEILIALVVIGTLAAIALPSYQNYWEKVRIAQAVSDIAGISANLKAYQLDNRYFPPTLNTLSQYNPVPNDPWGRPYQYLAIDIDPAPNKGAQRKDKNMNPLNSDFDLYSMGLDGQTQKPLTGAKARDDIVRADNGRFIGVAEDH